ncbi:MAG: hypothetical protein RL015_1038 [Verrucomicrobiota bacterium]|jgi:hypothetical protein
MKPEEIIDQALQDQLSAQDWQALLKDETALHELHRQVEMDAMLSVALEPAAKGQRLQDAIMASLDSASTESLRQEIERATLGTRRRARQRLGGPLSRWRTAAPRLWQAAAAMLLGGLIGSLAWPDLVSQAGLEEIVAAHKARSQPQIENQVPPPAMRPEPVLVKTEPVLPTPAPLPMPEPPKVAVVEMKPVVEAKAPAGKPTTAPAIMPKPATVAEATKPEKPAMAESRLPQVRLAAKPSPDVSGDVAMTLQGRVDFVTQVLPLLKRSCFECHSAEQKKPKGDIRLDDLAAIRDKSRTDSLVFPHKPDKSTLLRSLTLPRDHEDAMPPEGEGTPLTPQETGLIHRWIEEGADFGDWTSERAREVTISTSAELINAADAMATARRIDALILADLEKRGEKPRAAASDLTFVRRVHLDLVGRIPTTAETESFLKDKSPERHAHLIDRLLASNGHVSHMFNYWTTLLRARDQLDGDVKGSFYLAWIKQSIRDNKPYDQWARELLSPEGYGWRAPASGYYLRDGANRAANIETTASLFLGLQISCAQCHDHPYDKWTRKDYHQFMAWTSGIQMGTGDSKVGQVESEEIRKAKERYDKMAMNRINPEQQAKYEQIGRALEALQRAAGGSGVVNGEGQPAKLPDDYQYTDAKPGDLLPAAVLYGEAPKPGTRPADTLAEWITAPQNTRFSLALANRLWQKLFGLPFAGVPEQVREIADCTNPDLAQYLANVVRDSRYDLRQILRIFCLTQAYRNESSILPKEAEEISRYAFAGPVLRRLNAEQVWDSMMSLAVEGLDEKLDFDAPGVKELEKAVAATKASEVTTVARQMVSDEQRAMDAEQRRSRLRGEMAEEFAGGGFERASELPQPTPPGHFLRLFGQGNRDFINDNWTATTVPQALLMLNSDFFDHVARSGSPLNVSLRRSGSAREVARAAFLAILMREPEKEELDACIEILGESRNPKTLARTLLSTAEFAFQK